MTTPLVGPDANRSKHTRGTLHPAATDEGAETLASVLNLIRSGAATTRPELERRSALGRKLVTQRVTQLLDSGIIDEGTYAESTGGRPARKLRFHAEAGSILVADIGISGFAVAVTDLTGNVMDVRRQSMDIVEGPEIILDRVETLLHELLDQAPPRPLWGIGIGVPGPVEYRSGRPIAPPVMPGWDNYPIRSRFASKYGVPVWVDNDVNLMATGEYAKGSAQGKDNFLFVTIGSGIGAGLFSQGKLHRGEQGAAGDIGHVAVNDWTVCRCGNVGCLEAVAGGAALIQTARDAARNGLTPALARHADLHALTFDDLTAAANHGDRFTVDLLERAGELTGRTLATLVNFFNPSVVILGGEVAQTSQIYCEGIRQAIYRRSLPLATRHLTVERSTLGDFAGLAGAAVIVLEELFSPRHLVEWIQRGSPVGRVDLAS